MECDLAVKKNKFFIKLEGRHAFDFTVYSNLSNHALKSLTSHQLLKTCTFSNLQKEKTKQNKKQNKTMNYGESIPNCHLIINDNKILILPFKNKTKQNKNKITKLPLK